MAWIRYKGNIEIVTLVLVFYFITIAFSTVIYRRILSRFMFATQISRKENKQRHLS